METLSFSNWLNERYGGDKSRSIYYGTNIDDDLDRPQRKRYSDPIRTADEYGRTRAPFSSELRNPDRVEFTHAIVDAIHSGLTGEIIIGILTGKQKVEGTKEQLNILYRLRSLFKILRKQHPIEQIISIIDTIDVHTREADKYNVNMTDKIQKELDAKTPEELAKRAAKKKRQQERRVRAETSSREAKAYWRAGIPIPSHRNKTDRYGYTYNIPGTEKWDDDDWDQYIRDTYGKSVQHRTNLRNYG